MASSKEIRANPVPERTMEIQIQNNSKIKTLTDAATYNYSGHVCIPPAPVIRPGDKSDAMFVKTESATRGSVDILSYEFGSSQFTILFSNPFDYNLFNIEFALYITNTPEVTDKYLYRKMYSQLVPTQNYAKESLSEKSEALSVTGGDLTISATMSNEAHSIIKIDIQDI